MAYNKYAGIYAENNGTYTIKTTLTYKDGYVKNITKRGFNTKTEALSYKIKLVDEAKNTYYNVLRKQELTLHEFFNLYLEEYALSFKVSTKRGIEGIINLYLKPLLPNIAFNKLRPQHFTNFRIEIGKLDTLNSNSKNKRINLLKRIMINAIDKGHFESTIGRQCVLELQPIADDGHIAKNDYWEYEEFQAFINSFEDDDKYKLLFTCLFTFGCRIGEFRAIQFKDVNFDTNQIHIHKQVTSKLGTGKSEIVYYTKTNKQRFTTIPKGLANRIRQHKLDNNFSDDDFLFLGSTPISENAINKAKLKHCKLANVKPIRNHDFRHSYITYLIDNELDIKIVANQVGHTDVQTTLNIYNHISQKRKSKLNSVLDDMFN